jgi:hypothetical protein
MKSERAERLGELKSVAKRWAGGNAQVGRILGAHHIVGFAKADSLEKRSPPVGGVVHLSAEGWGVVGAQMPDVIAGVTDSVDLVDAPLAIHHAKTGVGNIPGDGGGVLRDAERPGAAFR